MGPFEFGGRIIPLPHYRQIGVAVKGLSKSKQHQNGETPDNDCSMTHVKIKFWRQALQFSQIFDVYENFDIWCQSVCNIYSCRILILKNNNWRQTPKIGSLTSNFDAIELSILWLLQKMSLFQIFSFGHLGVMREYICKFMHSHLTQPHLWAN